MDEFGNRVLDACKDAFPSTPDPTFVASVPPQTILLSFVLQKHKQKTMMHHHDGHEMDTDLQFVQDYQDRGDIEDMYFGLESY